MASGKGKVCNQYIGHPGIPVEHLRQRIDVIDGISIPMQYTKMTPRPVLPENFFESFSSIDVHDHYRQGSLAVERESRYLVHGGTEHLGPSLVYVLLMLT